MIKPNDQTDDAAAIYARVALVRAKAAGRLGAALGSDDLGAKLEIVIYNGVLRQCAAKKIPLVWDAVKGRYMQKIIGTEVYNIRRLPEVRALLQTGELPLKKFAAMPPWAISPELWADAFEKAAFKELRRTVTADAATAPDGAFVCRCKSRKTEYISLQTRSADEAETLFVHCLSCGRRWKS